MDFGLMIGFSLGVVDDLLVLERTWSCLFLWVFLCVCFWRKIWVYGPVRDWIGYLVFGLISSIYLWFCLVSWIYFLFSWIWWSRFGCWIWIWIWGMLEMWWRTRRTTSVFMKNNESKKNKKFKFCFLIYFLFWFKFSDMTFKKKLKCWCGI